MRTVHFRRTLPSLQYLAWRTSGGVHGRRSFSLRSLRPLSLSSSSRSELPPHPNRLSPPLRKPPRIPPPSVESSSRRPPPLPPSPALPNLRTPPSSPPATVKLSGSSIPSSSTKILPMYSFNAPATPAYGPRPTSTAAPTPAASPR